jgi:hypothetical protein
VVEICPLEIEDIKSIATKFLKQSDNFLKALAKLPFSDLANRPLFLLQLLVFYDRYNYMPERPSDVYTAVINLALEEWDAQRRIHRHSKYAGFNPRRKAEFLAALAYHITYLARKKVFSSRLLISAYERVCSGFGLPENEADKVASEIETHTGILVHGAGNNYEFSHLSLQEFLCASHLSRAPLSEFLPQYLAEYPAPLAVMVAIASDSANSLASVILAPNTYRLVGEHLGSISSFLSRLLLERPHFVRSRYLGFALLRLISLGRDEPTILERTLELINESAARESICYALTYFDFEKENSEIFKLSRFVHISPEFEFRLKVPDFVFLPKSVFQTLIAHGLISRPEQEGNNFRVGMLRRFPEFEGYHIA